MTVNINGTTGVSAVQTTALANTITTSMLQANSVNSQIIAAGSVTSSQLAANAANANITTGSLYPSQFAYPMTTMSANGGSATIVGSANVPFTGIPSWVRRITISINQISTSGSSIPGVQLGTSGGFVTTGYVTGYQYGSSATYGSPTALIPIYSVGTSGTTYSYSTVMILNLFDSTTNRWSAQGVATQISGGAMVSWYGTIALSGVATQVRLSTVNGTDTYSAGSVNVTYE